MTQAQTIARPWDEQALRMACRKHDGATAFANTVPKMRDFRDGRCPDGDAQADAWLRAFWERCRADGTAGCEPVGDASALPETYGRIARAVGAEWHRPFLKHGITLNSATRRVSVSVTTDATHMALHSLFAFDLTGAKGLGRTICRVLEDEAAERGLRLVATYVITPEFFDRIGWVEGDGYQRFAPNRAEATA